MENNFPDLREVLRGLPEAKPQSEIRGPNGGNPFRASIPTPEYRDESHSGESSAGIVTLHDYRPKAYQGVKTEQPWHRMAAMMLAAGMDRVAIAESAGVDPHTITVLKGQRWFQEILAFYTEQATRPIQDRLLDEASKSLDVLIEIRDTSDDKTPQSVRLSAARTIYEQAHGKPTQKILAATTSRVYRSAEEEMADLQNQLRALESSRVAAPAKEASAPRNITPSSESSFLSGDAGVTV